MSPRRLCLFNTKTGASKRDLNFKTSILAVRLSRKRLATTSMYYQFLGGSYLCSVNRCMPIKSQSGVQTLVAVFF